MPPAAVMLEPAHANALSLGVSPSASAKLWPRSGCSRPRIAATALARSMRAKMPLARLDLTQKLQARSDLQSGNLRCSGHLNLVARQRRHVDRSFGLLRERPHVALDAKTHACLCKCSLEFFSTYRPGNLTQCQRKALAELLQRLAHQPDYSRLVTARCHRQQSCSNRLAHQPD
jgi:hypothetical protein